MSTTNDKNGLRAAARVALMDERDRIARQSQSIGEAMRAMRDVHEQMLNRLIRIMAELQRRDALGTDTNNGEAK